MTWTRYKTRRRRLSFAKANLSLVFAVGGSFLVSAIAASLLFSVSDQAWASGAIFGTVMCSGFWVIRDLVDRGSGASTSLTGHEGEDWTEDALSRIPRSITVRGLVFENSYDVDHVVVCPDGIKAVETKRNAVGDIDLQAPWPSSDLRVYAADANRGARRIKYLLLSHGIRIDVEAVVVIWGPGIRDAMGGVKVINGVTFLVGRQAKTWSTLFSRRVLDDETMSQIYAALNEQSRIQQESLFKARPLRRRLQLLLGR